MLKNLDETVRLQSEKRQEWIRERRGERLQGIAEDTSVRGLIAADSKGEEKERRQKKQFLPGLPVSLR